MEEKAIIPEESNEEKPLFLRCEGAHSKFGVRIPIGGRL